jgi:hypothetical protein
VRRQVSVIVASGGAVAALRPRLQPRPSRLSSRSVTTQPNTVWWAVSTTLVVTSRVSRCSWPR